MVEVKSEATDLILRRAYESVKTWRERILLTAPCSFERSRVMAEMYAAIHQISNELDQTACRPQAYYSGFVAREKAALGLARLVRNARCLEIGAGGGALCRSIALQGWDIEGIDVIPGPDWNAIRAETNGMARFRVASFLTDPSFAQDTYDLCIMDNVLEHFPPGDYEAVLRKAQWLLKRGGWLVTVVPNPLVGPHDVSQYFVTRGQPAEGDHFSERTVRRLAKDLRAVGLRNIKTVAYGGISVGRRFGWSRLWYLKSAVCEWGLGALPPRLRSRMLFLLSVPPVLAAQKA